MPRTDDAEHLAVSLGGFGGYIVVGFDHSSIDVGRLRPGHRGQLSGRLPPSRGSSGHGDENGDGLPNDTWYELKGSETGKAETLQDYAVTYYRPRGAGMETRDRQPRRAAGSIA